MPNSGIAPNQINQFHVYFRTIIVCLGGQLFGLNNTVFNSAQEHIIYLNFWISKYDKALYTSLIAAAYPIGCIVGALFTDLFLRIINNSYKKSLIILDIIGIIGSIQNALNPSIQNLLLGRFVSGIAIGLNCAIVPLYVKIYTPQVIRGRAGALFQTSQAFGNFVGLLLKGIMPSYPKISETDFDLVASTIEKQSLFEREFSWRIVMGFPIIVCAIRLYCMVYVFYEETPQKLIQKRQFKKLKRFVEKIYVKEMVKQQYQKLIKENDTTEQEVQTDSESEDGSQEDQKQNQQKGYIENNFINLELQGQMQSQQKQNSELATIEGDKLKKPHLHPQIDLKEVEQKLDAPQEQPPNQQAIERSRKRRMWLGIVVQMSSQLNGLNGVMTFSSGVYKANTSSESIVQLYLAMQGLALFIFTLSSSFLIDRFGRRILLIVSALSTSIALLFVALFAYLDIFVLSFICILIYLGCWGIGIGGVVMPYCAELVDKNDVKTCIGFRWLSYMFIVLTFQFKIIALEFYGTFVLFSVFTALCLIYFLFNMKETKGLTTQQIQKMYF